MSRLLTDNNYRIMLVAESGELTRTMSAKVLADQLGVSERTVWRHVKRLLGQGMLQREPGGQYTPTTAWYSIRSHEVQGR